MNEQRACRTLLDFWGEESELSKGGRMKFKKLTIAPIPALVGVVFAALVAWGVDHWTGLGFWGSFAIVIVSMLINGIIAEVEDNQPGGFNNPRPNGREARGSSHHEPESDA